LHHIWEDQPAITKKARSTRLFRFNAVAKFVTRISRETRDLTTQNP
jgi:hypothetical protein